MPAAHGVLEGPALPVCFLRADRTLIRQVPGQHLAQSVNLNRKQWEKLFPSFQKLQAHVDPRHCVWNVLLCAS